MRILVTYPLRGALVRDAIDLGDDVVVHPLPARDADGALARALATHRPDALLVRGAPPDVATRAAWREIAGRPVQLVVRDDRPDGPRRATAESDAVPDVHIARVVAAPDDPDIDDLRALGAAERGLAEIAAAPHRQRCGLTAQPGAASLSDATVVLVGAGIVNLMTAQRLLAQGARVEILEASPDPRTAPAWQRLGTTHGGDDARVFCFTEANSYNRHLRATAGPHALTRTIRDGGWLAIEPDRLRAHERRWIARFRQLPDWRAATFAEDIHGFSIASFPGWQALRRDHPALFDDVGYAPGVLRLYADATQARSAEALHARLGSLSRSLDPAALVAHHPACRAAVARGEIVRALEIEGFSLAVHAFAAKLLAHLERQGARLHWNRRVERLAWTDDGAVAGLHTRDGVVRAQHYVLAPGVGGGALLDGMRSADAVQGVLGLWLRLPNRAPQLRRSVKIHREGHVGEDANVTVGRDADGHPLLILGSGYGFLGTRALDMDHPQIAPLFAALEETARRFFPDAYRDAVDSGLVRASRRACVRPFTSTGLGIFEMLPTDRGGRLVLAAGHNTGGFTQSPAVAEAVVTTLRGGHHAMQALYDPQRGAGSCATDDPTPQPAASTVSAHG
ncbi:MAG: FAD-dependent oxidoreductase [Acidobacteriota bacterium]